MISAMLKSRIILTSLTILKSPTSVRDVLMKSFAFICLLVATIPLTGCQSFQFVESPIPVKNLPAETFAVKDRLLTTVPNESISTPTAALVMIIPAKNTVDNPFIIDNDVTRTIVVKKVATQNNAQ